jgi:organic radical activating enzyme
MKHYSVNEIFLSIQGEGIRAGTANVFVRFAGCNLSCNGETVEDVLQPICDTEFVSSRSLTAAEVVAEVKQIAGKCRAVIFTGGEPLLQLDDELIQEFRWDAGWYLAIETNGTKPLPLEPLDFVCVSPKTAEHTIRIEYADELKYVRAKGQGIPKPACKADHFLLSPAWSPEGLRREDLQWVIELVKANPSWRLSLQTHKWMTVR